jgi:HAD superfamily phosphoserine phosphatase-like hydrolase
LQSVEDEVKSGAVVTLCSASPALVLQPFANRLGIKLIGTELEVVDGVLTGKLTGNNCRCENKVLRLEAVYGDLGEYRLRAWGDTRGDRELLEAAQDAHFRHFHSKKKQGKLQR